MNFVNSANIKMNLLISGSIFIVARLPEPEGRQRQTKGNTNVKM